VAEVLRAIHQPAGRPSRPVYRIMIAGGDQVSLRLALQLSRVPGRFHIKIIEPDEQRCQDLASLLPAEVLVDGDRYAVVRRRQSLDEMLSGEQPASDWRRT